MTTPPSDYRHDERFRKDERLRNRDEYLRVQRNGRRRADPYFIVYALDNERAHARLGLTVTTDVGKATTRNWWKRRLRESFRRNKKAIPVGYDYVVIVKADADRPDYDELEASVLELFRRAAGEEAA